MQRDRRRNLLFLAVVIVPSVVLLVATLRLVRQERELAERSQGEQQALLARQLGNELLVRIERLRLQALQEEGLGPEFAEGHPELVAVGRIRDGRLEMPWERPVARLAPRRVGDAHRDLLRRGESAEFAERRYLRAAELYRQAARAARDSTEFASALLHRARALVRGDRSSAARSDLVRLAGLPAPVRDEEGIPFALYAAELLLEAPEDAEAAYGAIARALRTSARHPPPALNMLLDLTERLRAVAANHPALADSAAALGAVARDRLSTAENLLGLRRALPGLLALPSPTTGSGEGEPGSAWIPYGSDPWLVGVGPGAGNDDSLAVVLRPQLLLDEIAVEGGLAGRVARSVRLVTAASPDADPLGPRFRSLWVSVPPHALPDPVPWSGAARFFVLFLPVILGLTLFTAYLVWRDMRREVEAAALRSQFVSSVTHELKTPLTSIRMFAETLRMRDDGDRRTREEYLETIVNESERLTRLINNVLDFTRLEQGEKTYHPRPTALEDVVADAAHTMAYPLEQVGFELTVDLEPDLPLANVDPDALEQAILNLLSNAMKYSGDSRRIELRLASRDGQALVQVTDHGRGVDPDEREAIFGRFYRSPEVEKQGIPGAGLGLTLVDHVAQAHGGSVQVESEPGRGSTFTIRLPLTSRSEEGAAPPAEGATGRHE